MKAMKWITGFLLAGTLAAHAADVVIQSFDSSGKITFNEVTNAAGYRVEWASSAGGVWINSWNALNGIPAAGSGVVTAAVPMLYRVVATIAPGMVLIPADSFVMGNATNVFPAGEGSSDELPQHTVYVSAFYMDQRKVTKALWDEVANWASTNGYDISAGSGSGKATNHPVQTVTWYECVKWCNARSQKEGLMTPCYTNTDGSVHTNGSFSGGCNWSANGYRLPTEAEWEKVARGGSADTRFPWTDYTNNISHAKANYFAIPADYSYDVNPTQGFNPAYTNGGYPYTSPVGYSAPNGYGLYDMVGNVLEWCWDSYDENYYSISPGTDPRGPASSPFSFRVLRGGSWSSYASEARCAYRNVTSPDLEDYGSGFRCARGP